MLISIAFPLHCLSDSTEINWASDELLTLALSTPQKNTSILEYLAKVLEKEHETLQISSEAWADTCYVEFNDYRIEPPATFVDYEKLESLTAERQKRGIDPLFHIDSLNTINSNLQAENVAYKKEITTAQLRADVAEERADELGSDK